MTNGYTDLALTENDDGIMDESIGADGDFVGVDNFNTAIQMSFGAEKRADESIVPMAMKRRGWSGNEASDTPGFEMGSLLWLNHQARSDTNTKNAQVAAAKDCIEWLVSDGYLNGIRVSGSLKSEGIQLVTELVRKDGKIDKLYYKLWEETGF